MSDDMTGDYYSDQCADCKWAEWRGGCLNPEAKLDDMYEAKGQGTCRLFAAGDPEPAPPPIVAEIAWPQTTCPTCASVEAEREAALADAAAWQGFAASIAVAVHRGETGEIIANHLAIDDLPNLRGAVSRAVTERDALLADVARLRGNVDALLSRAERMERERDAALGEVARLRAGGAS